MTEEEMEKLESEYFRSYCDLRKFIHLFTNEKDKVPEISLSLQDPGGGVTGEFMIKFYDFNDYEDKISPRIECFSDATHVLICFNDVIKAIHSELGETYTPDELISLLDELGFIDSDSFEGDYIPDEMFGEYQKNRIRKKNRKEGLKNLLDEK